METIAQLEKAVAALRGEYRVRKNGLNRGAPCGRSLSGGAATWLTAWTAKGRLVVERQHTSSSEPLVEIMFERRGKTLY